MERLPVLSVAEVAGADITHPRRTSISESVSSRDLNPGFRTGRRTGHGSGGKNRSRRRGASLRGKNEARGYGQPENCPPHCMAAKAKPSLSVNAKQVGAILRSESGHNTLFQVDLGGKHEPAILKDWQVDPVSGKLLHVDLLRIAMDVRMRVKVPVHTFGEPKGVKVEGGVLRSRRPRSGNRMLARRSPDGISGGRQRRGAQPVRYARAICRSIPPR